MSTKLMGAAVLVLLIACNQKKITNADAKNESTAVEETNPYKKVDTTKKQIYLTFDDGPTTGSLKLYNYLLQKKVPVTLYLVGKHYDAMPGLHKLLDSVQKQPYIVTANHSYSHAYNDRYDKFYNDVPGVINDYHNAQQVLGITSNIARCAGRNVWRTTLLTITDDKGPGTAMDSLYKEGYNFTGWDFSWNYDYRTFVNKMDADSVMRRVNKFFDNGLTYTANNIVILGHDQQYADDADFKQLTDFIDRVLASNKYQFMTMDKYPGINKKL